MRDVQTRINDETRPSMSGKRNGKPTVPRLERLSSESTANQGTPKRVETATGQRQNSIPATPPVFQTPALQRRRGLGIEAMLNSARKAMSLLQVPRGNGNSETW